MIKHTTKCDHAPTYKDIRKLILKQLYATLYFKNGCKGTYFLLDEQKNGQENAIFAVGCSCLLNYITDCRTGLPSRIWP